MKSTLAFLLIAVLFCASANGGALRRPFSNRNTRIIGGRDAADGELPYTVAIEEKFIIDYFFHCGGVLIDSLHVLTSADCIYWSYARNLRIVAGTRDLSNSNDPNRVVQLVATSYVHRSYNYHRAFNDIAVIRVQNKFPVGNGFIEAIPLRLDTPSPPAECVVSGWGDKTIYNSSEKYSDILQVVNVSLIDFDECAYLYEGFPYTTVEPGMVCAGVLEGGKDACTGDTGGPLVCGGQLTGLVSWGAVCGLPFFPGVYTDVGYYHDWIEDTVETSLQDAGLL